MRQLVAALRRRRLLVGTGAAFALLAGVAGATPGAFGGYRATIGNSTDTAASATYFHCVDALAADKSSAVFQWMLGDTTGSTAADSSGQAHTGSYQGTARTTTTTAPLACPRDSGAAWAVNGASSWAYYPTQITNPTTFTEEIWFKTSVAGGRLMGFGTGSTGTSGQYDRHLYIDKNGAVVFGVYANAIKTLQTTGNYADGAWHYAAGVLSPSGMSLYVDGALVQTTTAVTTAESDSGYWRVGYDALGGSWPNVSTAAFNGTLRYAAVYSAALSAAQIKAHFAAGAS